MLLALCLHTIALNGKYILKTCHLGTHTPCTLHQGHSGNKVYFILTDFLSELPKDDI